MEVVAAETREIAISFRFLLNTITEQLHLNNAAIKVSIDNDYGQVVHEYSSQVIGSFEGAFEAAARRVVQDLAKKYYIYIEDISSMKQQEIERCTELYNIKCIELKRLDKRWKQIPLAENPITEFCADDEVVPVDFIPILRSLITEFKIPCSPLESIQHNPLKFRAWLFIIPPNSYPIPQPIFGDSCTSLRSAKQNLARKVIQYLSPLYSFEVIDANYNPLKLKQLAALCARAKQNYFTLRESVLGIEVNAVKPYQLIEQDCLTPRTPAFIIPPLSSPPLPPKKRKPLAQYASSSTNNNATPRGTQTCGGAI